ncbi:MAG: hypothetical protein KDC38_16900 [Planctomycetes bacterium]|nr:hypothetical protein [Planctomycetota bacterium]
MAESQPGPPIEGVQLDYPESPVVDEVLDRQTLLLVAFFESRFRERRRGICEKQARCREDQRTGTMPGFLLETEHIRLGDWRVDPPPPEFESRRVEIVSTLETERLVSGLSSVANSVVVDFRDSYTDDTTLLLRGQLRLRQAVAGTLAHQTRLGTAVIGDDPAAMIIRPRALCDPEPNLRFEGQPISGGLLDVLVYLAHCGKSLVDQESSVCLELPVEDYLEAQLWAEILDSAETLVRLPRGSIRISVAVESLTALLQSDEILHALRTRAIGLSHGTWRYVQNFLECFPDEPRRVHPDRAAVFSSLDYLRFSTRYLVQVAHKRGTFAIAPCCQYDSDDPVGVREAGRELVHELADDIAEGYDGKRLTNSRLALVVARSFDTAGVATDQRDAFPYGEGVTVENLTTIRPRPITEEGLRRAIRSGLAQIAAWSGGRSTVHVDHFLENRASAAVARLLVRQWIRHPNGILPDGVVINKAIVREIFAEEMRALSGRESELGCTDDQLLGAVRALAQSLAAEDARDRVLENLAG